MGATVTTGKLVAAFEATNGKKMYLLFEEMYEKNCHPHTPAWNCNFIGPVEEAIRHIFQYASSCEGGMLQGRGGQITPEGYIAGWLKELANPVEFSNRRITLVIGTSYSSAIPAEKTGAVKELLSGMGRQDIVDALDAGEAFSVDLYEDADLVAAIYDGKLMAPWRIIRGHEAPTHGARNADLGYAPAKARPTEFELPAFLKVDGDARLIRREDGTWYCAGWEYSIIASHVSGLWQVELREPGSFRRRIKAFRDAIKGAPSMPEGMVVSVDLSVPLDCSYSRKMVDRLPGEVPVVHTEKGYEVAVTGDKSLIWRLTQLPPDCAAWVLP